MSAPKTAYKNTSLFRGNIEHLVAILQVSEATHKSRFYLDGYISVMTPDGKGGVVGYVALGSANANMHNLVKRGGGLRSLQGGQVVQLLNDGGLNTYGLTSKPVGGTENNVFEFFINSFNSKSAHYIDGKFGLSFSDNNGVSWKDFDVEDFQVKNSSENSELYDLGSNRSFPLVATRTVLVRSYHDNEEGRKYSATTSIYVNAWRIQNVRLAAITSWPSLATQNEGDLFASEKIYLGSTAVPAGKLSYNEDGTSLVDYEGWYVTDEFWLKYTGDSPSSYKIVEYGVSTPQGWPPGDPNSENPTPSIKIGFVNDGATEGAACTSSTTIVGYLYRTLEAPFIYYENETMSITANGFYVFLETRPNRGNPWNQFVNGVMVDNGVCPYYDPNQ